MATICCILFGYLIGGINPAYIIGRLKGFDIRQRGSGNAGASNATILMGKKVGAFSAVFDILKTFFVVLLMSILFPQFRQAKILTGISCILGHVFPAAMRFRGGKGLACLGGFILAYNWRVFLIMLLLELVLVLIVDYICFVPITASIAFPFLYAVREQDLLGAGLFFIVVAVILYKHMENLRRIRRGGEAHFSFLWKRDKEIARLTQNGADEEILEDASKTTDQS